MNPRANSFSKVLVFLVAGAILISGCSEEDTDTQVKYLDFHAVVRNQVTGQPVAGVKLVLMDAKRNLPVAGPIESDQYGVARFGILPEDDMELLAFGGLEYLIFSIAEQPPSKGMHDPGDSPFAPRSKTSPPPFHSFTVSVFKVSATDSLARIAGKVIDAETGRPLDQVFVSLSPYLTGYQHVFDTGDDVTLSDGLFTAYNIPFTVNPVSGNIAQVQPLRFTRAGYRPTLYSEDPPNGHFDLDFRGALIAMEPVSSEDTASISGRLLRGGAPVAGVIVGIGVLDTTSTVKSGPGMTGWTGVTDADGLYHISDLPQGAYWLQPGFPVGDGVFFPGQENIERVEVAQGAETVAKDLVVLHEIRPLTPAHGSMWSSAPDTLRWTEVPGATRYDLQFDFTDLPSTETNSAPLPSDLLQSGNWYYWYVVAYNDSNELMGAYQQSFRFTLERPDD